MGVGRLLRRAAARGPVPVFVAAGTGGRAATLSLSLRPEVEIVASPRHATVLLVAGTVPPVAATTLGRVHDQLPHPRATVWWDVAGGSPPPLPADRHEGDAEAVAAALLGLHRSLVWGTRPSEPAVSPDVDPNEWRGVGPFGQGGKGMTGGTPYGRPLAGRAPDRDGLQLDQLTVTLGPWLSVIPAGPVLQVRLQGDVVQEATVQPGPLGGTAVPDVFHRALEEPTPVVDLELARARHHLVWACDVLRLVGLAAESRRVLRVAMAVTPGARPDELVAARRTAAALASSRRMRHPLAGVAPLTATDAGDIGGPVGRASGCNDDARCADGAYGELGFAPVVDGRGDAWGRWRVRLGEAVQSLELAGAAGDRATSVTGTVETPRGPLRAGSRPSPALADLVPRLLPGLEWGDAVVALAGLDIDPCELAAERPVADAEAAS